MQAECLIQHPPLSVLPASLRAPLKATTPRSLWSHLVKRPALRQLQAQRRRQGGSIQGRRALAQLGLRRLAVSACCCLSGGGFGGGARTGLTAGRLAGRDGGGGAGGAAGGCRARLARRLGLMCVRHLAPHREREPVWGKVGGRLGARCTRGGAACGGGGAPAEQVAAGFGVAHSQ